MVRPSNSAAYGAWLSRSLKYWNPEGYSSATMPGAVGERGCRLLGAGGLPLVGEVADGWGRGGAGGRFAKGVWFESGLAGRVVPASPV